MRYVVKQVPRYGFCKWGVFVVHGNGNVSRHPISIRPTCGEACDYAREQLRRIAHHKRARQIKALE